MNRTLRLSKGTVYIRKMLLNEDLESFRCIVNEKDNSPVLFGYQNSVNDLKRLFYTSLVDGTLFGLFCGDVLIGFIDLDLKDGEVNYGLTGDWKGLGVIGYFIYVVLDVVGLEDVTGTVRWGNELGLRFANKYGRLENDSVHGKMQYYTFNRNTIKDCLIV